MTSWYNDTRNVTRRDVQPTLRGKTAKQLFFSWGHILRELIIFWIYFERVSFEIFIWLAEIIEKSNNFSVRALHCWHYHIGTNERPKVPQLFVPTLSSSILFLIKYDDTRHHSDRHSATIARVPDHCSVQVSFATFTHPPPRPVPSNCSILWLTFDKSTSSTINNNMASTVSESSIDSPAERIVPVQPPHAPGINGMVQNQTRSLPAGDSYHAHANRDVQHPQIVPIPECPRDLPPQTTRAQQRQFQQSSHSGLQEARCEYKSWTLESKNSKQYASHAISLFSEGNPV